LRSTSQPKISKLRAAALALAVALSLFPLLAVTAAADANPDNRGHHYGQLKHPRHHPPTPSPSPGPSPGPGTPGPVGRDGPGSTQGVPALGDAAVGLPATGLAIGIPDLALGGQEQTQVGFRPAVESAGAYPWAIEALIAALVAIWAGLLLVAVVRRRRRRERA
jgi:hypothetical protein